MGSYDDPRVRAESMAVCAGDAEAALGDAHDRIKQVVLDAWYEGNRVGYAAGREYAPDLERRIRRLAAQWKAQPANTMLTGKVVAILEAALSSDEELNKWIGEPRA